jgi:hypothetical protein
MSERIIYCHVIFYHVLDGQKYQEIGHLEDGIWAVVDDSNLLAIKDRNPAVPLLYFSKADYEHAMRKLPVMEVNKVIRKRLERWAPGALDQAVNWLYQGERRCLTLTALGQVSQAVEVAGGLDQHFEQTLQLLAKITGEGRYDDVSLASLLIFALEGEAKIVAELELAKEAMRTAKDGGEDQRLVQRTESRKKYAQMLGNMLRRLGRSEYGGALPHVDVQRGVWITPPDAELLGGLRIEHRPFVEWREGVVTQWVVRQVPELMKRGKKATMLYLNSGALLEDMDELTPAQLEREFEERLSGRGSSAEAIQDHLNSLQLEQILLKRNLVEKARVQGAEFVKDLADQVAEDTLSLKTALVQRSSWLSQAPGSSVNALAMLKVTEQQIAQDTALFKELSQRAGNNILQKRFEVIGALVNQKLISLNALSGVTP